VEPVKQEKKGQTERQRENLEPEGSMAGLISAVRACGKGPPWRIGVPGTGDSGMICS